MVLFTMHEHAATFDSMSIARCSKKVKPTLICKQQCCLKPVGEQMFATSSYCYCDDQMLISFMQHATNNFKFLN